MQKHRTISMTLIIITFVTVPFIVTQIGYGRSNSPALQLVDEYFTHLPVVMRHDSEPTPTSGNWEGHKSNGSMQGIREPATSEVSGDGQRQS